ncbi:class I SAM-dependent methyltransferase [Ktedonosporobacter rubrisoli]|uniref:Class I SAM-dependent methyltransferase n=1 Tax=Ktedonosporobacter rubrisoli TaxID=2509675 RepID=A0A4P6K0I2_KTERU|nr:class I SAM-dependent methyltransferase [Ktedonosporobacter rubrisoli]QBD81313.1 class I SAM-dependent methyltransferase [Ktedonosporobacter rubrisoli]
MTSISFDAVAHRYDASRGFSQDVTRQLTEAIVALLGTKREERIFEVGVGTGRIALPLLEYGYHYTGVDISMKMLDKFQDKLQPAGWREKALPWGSLPNEQLTERQPEVRHFVHEGKAGELRLVVADMTELPFHSQSFDVVIATHVFHLISSWQDALKEILRVLKPGGLLLRCLNEGWEKQWHSGAQDIKTQWSSIVEELGGTTRLPGATDQEVTTWLQQMGLSTELIPVTSFQSETRPRVILEEIEQRLWTYASVVPDAIFYPALERLRVWAHEHYGENLDTTYVKQTRLAIGKTQV